MKNINYYHHSVLDSVQNPEAITLRVLAIAMFVLILGLAFIR